METQMEYVPHAVAGVMVLLVLAEIIVLWRQYQRLKALVIPVLGLCVTIPMVLSDCEPVLGCVVEKVVFYLCWVIGVQFALAFFVPPARFKDKIARFSLTASTYAELGDYDKAAGTLRDCIGFYLKYRHKDAPLVQRWALVAVALDTLQKTKIGILKLRQVLDSQHVSSTSKTTYFIDYEVFRTIAEHEADQWSSLLCKTVGSFIQTYNLTGLAADYAARKKSHDEAVDRFEKAKAAVEAALAAGKTVPDGGQPAKVPCFDANFGLFIIDAKKRLEAFLKKPNRDSEQEVRKFCHLPRVLRSRLGCKL